MTNNKCPICGKSKKNPNVKTCGDYSCMGSLAHKTRRANIGSGWTQPVSKGRRKKKGKKYVQKTFDMILRDLNRVKEKILLLKEKNLR